MKHLCTAILLCIPFVAAGTDALAQEHHHDHAAAVAAPTQRWTPDASLRDGIRKVHAAVDELHHYELGHMSAPMALDRAAAIEAAVGGMFAHCRLAPGPDAALHGILLPLLRAAQALKADPGNAGAVADMRAAIARYPQYFDDPGWDAAPATHEMHDEP